MCPLRKDGRPVTPVGGHNAGQLAHVSDSPDSAGPKLSPSHAPATDPSLSLAGVSVGWGQVSVRCRHPVRWTQSAAGGRASLALGPGGAHCMPKQGEAITSSQEVLEWFKWKFNV